MSSIGLVALNTAVLILCLWSGRVWTIDKEDHPYFYWSMIVLLGVFLLVAILQAIVD